ncbi:MAG: MFS transporter [Fimbriimonas sp.]
MSRPRPQWLSPLVGIFLTVFIDLLSFGLVIPDIQLRAETLGARGEVLGLALGIFSLAQLLTAPYLGRLSDRIGRRKILLITCTIAVISFLVYANAENLTVIFIARILSGVAGANVGVAFAYVADVTKPEERSKGMGMIGAAFGLGFVFGPVLGALLIRAGDDRPQLLGYVAAGLALINLLYVYFALPESHPVRSGPHTTFGQNIRKAFGVPSLALLLVMFFVFNFAFTNLETTFFRLLQEPTWQFALPTSEAKQSGAYVLALVGVVGVIMQGFVIRLVTPIFGEVKLLRIAYLIVGPVLLSIPYTPLWVPFLGGVILLGIGTGLAQPSMSSLISRNAPADMQGGIFGITQALGAVARFVGPIVSNRLFEVSPAFPYVLAAGLVIVPAIAAWFVRMPEGVASPEGAIEIG